MKRIQKDIESINAFNASPGSGITRQTFSKEYQGAAAYVLDELKKIGAEISIGLGGNIRGRIPGSVAGGPAIMTGSHLDTVAHGGPFDGVAGVAAALEAARCLVEDRTPHRLPVDVVVFAEEEGSRFGRALLGSSIWTGKIAPDLLHLIADANGVNYAKAMAQAGLSIDDDCPLRSAGLKAMLEVHVEQGAVLEKKGCRIGVVEAIAGIRQFDVTIRGKANHAGATPMPDRLDALQTAARIIVAIDEMAVGSPNTVATVGRIGCEPDQINIIPGVVRFSLDVRDSDKSRLETATAGICRNIAEMCADRGVTCEIGELTHVEPVVLNDGIIQLLEKKTREKNAAPLRMISGAGHDAALVAALTPTGLIFVPSREGLSHCPEEFTRIEDVALGCDILLAAIVELAQ